MNGYENLETYSLALWLNNIEWVKNYFLPELLKRKQNDVFLAAEELREFAENDLATLVGSEEIAKRIRNDVASFKNIAWNEFFDEE